jgi:hypothetical protein
MPEKGSLLGKVKSRIGDTGRKAESRLIKRVGGKSTPASGNMEGAKGDVVLPEFLMETKATENASYSLQHDLLAKITREALEAGKQPAFHVQFVDATGRPKKMGSWVMVPEQFLEEIQAIYAERYHG